MKHFTAFISGLTFGIGLLLAGMANPNKVLAFLDIAGVWDPSLMFVMVGAIAVGIFAFSWASKHDKSILKQPINLPNTQNIDKRLIIGASLFGIGWGIAGICPGPAIVLLGVGEGIYFFVAMLAGMLLFKFSKQ